MMRDVIPQSSTDERPAGRLARLPCELVLGSLVLLCLAFDVQAAPLMWLFEEGWWGAGGYVAVGAMLAQPALLGLWAVVGPQRAAIQCSRALILLTLVWWAHTLGTGAGWIRIRERRPLLVQASPYATTHSINTEDAFLTAGGFLGVFVLAQLPLAVARFVWQWRVSRPIPSSRYAPPQFTLRRPFCLTSFVALLLAPNRYLLHHSHR